jgi:hypothetical protein
MEHGMRQNPTGRAHRLQPLKRTAPWTSIAVFSAMMVTAASAPVRAGMLDADSCRRHKTEYDTLGGSGIREMMAKGPDWAKANLTKERMEQVRRYLALEEDVRFRCPLGKARPELEAAENEAGATTPLNADETAPAAKAPPAAKPARKSKQSATRDTLEQGSATALAPASANGKSGQQPEAAASVVPKSAAAKQKSTSAISPQPPAPQAVEPITEPVRKSPR